MKKGRAMHRREFFVRLASCCGAGAALLGTLPWAERWLRLRPSAKPLGELTCADFTPAVGSRFRMTTSTGQHIWMTLRKAEEHGPHTRRPMTPGLAPQRAAFSLVFKAAGNSPLGQDAYLVEHPRLGAFPLFLAAVGAGRGGVSTFEAVFG